MANATVAFFFALTGERRAGVLPLASVGRALQHR